MVFSAFSDGGWDLYRLDDPCRGSVHRTPGEQPVRPRGRSFRRPGSLASEASLPALDVGAGTSRQGAGTGDGETDEPHRKSRTGSSAPSASAADAVSYYLGEREAPRVAMTAARTCRASRIPSTSRRCWPIPRSACRGTPTGTRSGTTRSVSSRYRRAARGRIRVRASEPSALPNSRSAISWVTTTCSSRPRSTDRSATATCLFLYANLKKRMNWGAAVPAAKRFRAAVRPTSSDGQFLYRSDVLRGVRVFGSYPLSRFTRFELGAVATHVNRRLARFDPFDPAPRSRRTFPTRRMRRHRPPTSTTPRSTVRRGRSAGAGSGSR